MNCLAARDRLAERALGSLPARDAGPVDRHLAWCAACRKEAAELDSAAAMLAFSVAPAPGGPAPGLEDRIVEAVQGEAAGRAASPPEPPRRARLVLVAVVAAALSLSGLGWGAVMAGRAARSDEAMEAARRRQQTAIEQFRELLGSAEFRDPEGDVFLGTLESLREGGGGGSALTLTSPSIPDMAIVLVDGVPPGRRSSVPFVVRLLGPRRGSIAVGSITGLDDGGSGIVVRKYESADLSVFDRVVVRNAEGRVVLRGPIALRAPLVSPAP